jgi:hypothetical protein
VSNYVEPDDLWNDGVGDDEPEYTECKRCHGLGVDDDDACCMHCGGTGEIELR